MGGRGPAGRSGVTRWPFTLAIVSHWTWVKQLGTCTSPNFAKGAPGVQIGRWGGGPGRDQLASGSVDMGGVGRSSVSDPSPVKKRARGSQGGWKGGGALGQ